MRNQKLSPEYFGPFLVEAKVEPVAYMLAFCQHDLAFIPLFHVSQLKKYIGKAPNSNLLPLEGTDGALSKEPLRILDRRMVRKGDHILLNF